MASKKSKKGPVKRAAKSAPKPVATKADPAHRRKATAKVSANTKAIAEKNRLAAAKKREEAARTKAEAAAAKKEAALKKKADAAFRKAELVALKKAEVAKKKLELAEVRKAKLEAAAKAKEARAEAKAQAAKMAKRPRDQANAKTTAGTLPLDARIVEACLSLTAGRRKERVRLSALRPLLAAIRREDLDRQLVRMQRLGQLILYRDDHTSALTDADHAAALIVGDSPRHLVYLED